jgi:hypothetical protein
MRSVRRIGQLVGFCLVLVAPALAQQGSGAPPARPAMPADTSIAGTVDREVSIYEFLVVGAAEAMPEDKFNFTPASLNVPGSAFKDVRTFGALVKHTGAANYVFWSGVTGEKLPANINGLNGPDDLTTKAQIVQFLKDSFALGHRAAKSLTPANVMEQVEFRNNKSSRLFMATFAIVHCGDDYGQMVEYLRMNGIVPPASRGQ